MQLKVVPLKSLIVLPGRGRKEFARIEELSNSIKQQGFINPILCAPSATQEGKFEIIAGERRYRGAVLAGLTEVPITFREGISALDLKVMELEENVCRQDLSWQEECELHRQIDELKRSKDPNWEQKDTAKLVQLTSGHVSAQIKMAKKLKENPELRAKIKNLPMRAAEQVIECEEQVAKVERLQSQGKLAITTDLRLGSCLDLIKDLPTGSIDCLIMDPPYGVEELEVLRTSGSNSMTGHQMMSEHHNMTIDEVLKLLTKLGPELARVMKPGAHFYCFAACQYLNEFAKALAPLEAKWPCNLWLRERPTTIGYGYNFMSRAEFVLYGCNPPQSIRLSENHTNIFEHPDVPRNQRMYPTEKPINLLKEFIKLSTKLGDTVLDCFAGSASTMKAARELGRKSIGFEINPDSWKRAQLSLSGQTFEPEPSLLPDEQLNAKAASAKFEVTKKGG